MLQQRRPHVLSLMQLISRSLLSLQLLLLLVVHPPATKMPALQADATVSVQHTAAEDKQDASTQAAQVSGSKCADCSSTRPVRLWLPGSTAVGVAAPHTAQIKEDAGCCSCACAVAARSSPARTPPPLGDLQAQGARGAQAEAELPGDWPPGAGDAALLKWVPPSSCLLACPPRPRQHPPSPATPSQFPPRPAAALQTRSTRPTRMASAPRPPPAPPAAGGTPR